MASSGGAVADAEAVPLSASGVIVETRDLHRAYQGVHAVDGVSIELAQGRLTGLIGPNGAGKSTLLGMLAGMVAPTAGSILYEGRDITGTRTFERARAGLVRTFQLSSEFKRLTVLENLLAAVPRDPGDSLSGALFRRPQWRRFQKEQMARAGQLLEECRLTAHADTFAGDLSGGQRRLVEIMRALMATPRVLLLDEPMAGVHPRLAIEIGEHLLRLRDEGVTILMVEHELSIVDQLCDPVVVMAEGRVLSQGTMSALRQRPEVVEAYLVG
ncbi:MAG TPA: ABC transporter ATP-binding protein [Candidatus Micrarchaeia archaeon]|nr:ABC transporter ATP-binding protein [Candidatus Micrarchaeia archaeon]